MIGTLGYFILSKYWSYQSRKKKNDAITLKEQKGDMIDKVDAMIQSATPEALKELDDAISKQMIEGQKMHLPLEHITSMIAPLKQKRDLLALAVNYKDIWSMGGKDVAKMAFQYIKGKF